MPSNPFIEQRRIMKQLLYKMMSENREMEEDRIIAIFCLKTGIREKTAREYLREMKNAGIEFRNEQKTLNKQKTLPQ